MELRDLSVRHPSERVAVALPRAAPDRLTELTELTDGGHVPLTTAKEAPVHA